MALSDSSVDLRIAYIGGGSRGWARTLMGDLACAANLNGEIRLYDRNPIAAQMNAELGNWLQRQPEVTSRWHYRAVEQLKDALRGADFVFISIQPGSLELMAHEVGVAEKYGLCFPVGDTTGAPGLMRGLRSALIYRDYAHAIAEYCPAAWVINYSNPMSICTRTLTRVEPVLKVIGCCHEVFGTQRLLAELAQMYLELEAPPPREEIHINVLGINHFTWIDRADYEGTDLLALAREHLIRPGVLRPYTRAEVEATQNYFVDHHQVKFTLLKHYGILAAAGDRHLCEFVHGFTRSDEELLRWGLIRTPISFRIAERDRGDNVVHDYIEGRKPWVLRRSNEEAVRQLRALVGLADLVTNINMKNTGQVSNLPQDAVVETNAHFSRAEVRPLAAGALPPAVASLVGTHIANQEMIIEAALTRDRDLAFQAVFNDPTTDLPIDQAWAMFNEIGLPEGF